MPEKMQVKKIKVTKSTWCGRAGTVTEYQFQSSSLGKRVFTHVWSDTPDVVKIAAMTGSYWRGPKGHTYESLELVNPTEEKILSEVDRLANLYFSNRSPRQ